MNSIDEIIELYMKDVDMTLIEEQLKLTFEERLKRLEEFEEFREALQSAMEHARDSVR